MNQPSDKIARFQQLVAAQPSNLLHQFALASAYLASGDWDAGERGFLRCLDLSPEWMVAAIKRGRCLVELERWDEARASLDLGARLAQKQQHDEPFAEIRELLDRIPEGG